MMRNGQKLAALNDGGVVTARDERTELINRIDPGRAKL